GAAPSTADADPAAPPRLARRAEVDLPATLDGGFRLRDPGSGVAIEVRLDGARAATRADVDGFALYRGGFADGARADVLLAAGLEGVEDALLFAVAPPDGDVRYQVTLGARVAGLRVVADAVEFVDAEGTPRLRMAPP